MGGKGSGARPLPAEVKQLRGTYRPSRANPARPEPRQGALRCPTGTPEAVAAIFRRIVRELEPTGMLRPVDTDALLRLATALYLEREAARDLVENGATYADKAHKGRIAKAAAFQVWRDAGNVATGLAARFGLTPSDRERLSAPPQEDGEDELTKLLARREERRER